MTELYALNKTAVLLYIVLYQSKDIDGDLKEFLSLSSSANINIINTVFSHLKVIYPRYFVGKGKLLELKSIIERYSASLVVCNVTLSASQERNLIDFLRCKIIDRNQLILHLFTRRARTYEGKLQVKLAQLRYINSRLTHEWSHLERQTGGIGIRGGPGEMQLESDRRVLSKNILQVLEDLKKIENQRSQNRRRRLKIGISSISLIGYTNAGKSTLFNVLTSSNVNISHKLFSTIDPTFRYIVNNYGSKIMLIDTVGFIKNLPEDLISSFKATLKETMQSELLLHIVDYSDKKFEQNIDTVNHILSDINIYNIPVLMVMNKIDQNNIVSPCIDRNYNGQPIRVWISAQKNLGIDLLKVAINDLIPQNMIRYKLRIPIDSDIYQKLYKLQVIEEYDIENQNTVKLKIYLSTISWNRLLKCHKSLSNYII